MLHAPPANETRLFAGGCADELDPATVAALVGEPHLEPGARRQARPGDRRPLDEADRGCVQVVLEQGRFLEVEICEPVEVEVGDRDPAAVAATDRKGRRDYRLLDSERAAGAPDQGRLSGPDLTDDEDEVARLEFGREAGADRLGVRCRFGNQEAAS
jgi:hypothetical protein